LSDSLELADPFNVRLPDGGPKYTETIDLNRSIVEPWNAGSALLFLLIVAFWVYRLRGRYRQYAFLTACLPLLAAGGIGGTLYHAFRSSYVFFLLDVQPIGLLCLATSIYLALAAGLGAWARARVWPAILAGIALVLVVGLTAAIRWLTPGPPLQTFINLSYGLLAVLILAPLAVILVRTRFRHGVWVGAALLSFGIALFFRCVDPLQPPLLPMGTHWLWHTFGAAAVAALSEYLYLLRREQLLRERLLAAAH
jgi:hypothetical protein